MKKGLDAKAQATVIRALRVPRGGYPADRAAQLSGIPRRTLYDWRQKAIYIPDFSVGDPVAWSYRDLVFLRLLAWLRQLGMPRPLASEHVGKVKGLLARGVEVRLLRADSKVLLINEERTNRFTGVNLLPFDDIFGLLSTFDLLEPVAELSPRGHRMWAPDLVTPSEHTFISPWILAGDPCIQGTRIPTSAIHALRGERGLSSADVVELYPGLTLEGTEDAYLLERRLRGRDLPEPAAA